ncbi:acetyl/propionyl/methylcrotonyl-CoA carboxylase subunit alpha [Paremcibacter congregatus]|uniref:3-methylcrotonyl-CoA carboxylase n=1 Tax=Paremcibacter congregatus TaxID=2043170 RepID=A0A2G4YW36_9PROT|nr:acetyl/propionyl/methylcrotonyl-CoA carboxylase subunit alpha [Paremcibacter congregatus]PHZ86460.1 3-methylcrotonyl-CoA carboxylase [Paremcibacter congregatus]QDE28443.1 acetyl/propionyl/methylcrotonyl-CoA carboxylase subunit alpha [Paremcibacter congregatus]
MFSKILIANRGEIACRVIETAQKNGITAVAVYSDADQNARHVRLADEAYHIGGAEARDSYLKPDVILEVAQKCGAEAIHPGYGFLSENAEFSEACAKAGIAFIGPSPDSIRSMGLKDKAKDIMDAAGVPIVPGYQGADQDPKVLQKAADDIGYPVLIKAVAGGGGKGMRLVDAATDFIPSLESCQREAQASFGNAHVLIEKYLTKPRHIEVQVFGDTHGEAVYLYERDCSLQRRHQKVVEEAPAPGMSDRMRAEMGDAAVRAAKAIGYAGAGTIEFIVDVSNGLDKAPFYFMEMNTRLQVEHPVTELITGQDLVEWQLRVAAGEPLPLAQADIPLMGHAFEVRLYAEDPENNFMPQTGTLRHFSTPRPSQHFRCDTGVETGDVVSIYYDPMIAKLIVWDRDREGALRQMRKALRQTAVAGLKCNLAFLAKIIDHPTFAAADLDTGFIERYRDDLMPTGNLAGPQTLALVALAELRPRVAACDPWDSSDGWRMNLDLKTKLTFVDHEEKRDITVTYLEDGFALEIEDDTLQVQILSQQGDDHALMIDGHKVTARIIQDGQDFTLFRDGKVSYLHHYLPGAEGEDEAGGSGVIITPMPGKVTQVLVTDGELVSQGQALMILEAMKMEHTIKAQVTGTIEGLTLKAGDQVADGQVLIRITAAEEAAE